MIRYRFLVWLCHVIERKSMRLYEKTEKRKLIKLIKMCKHNINRIDGASGILLMLPERELARKELDELRQMWLALDKSHEFESELEQAADIVIENNSKTEKRDVSNKNIIENKNPEINKNDQETKNGFVIEEMTFPENMETTIYGRTAGVDKVIPVIMKDGIQLGDNVSVDIEKQDMSESKIPDQNASQNEHFQKNGIGCSIPRMKKRLF